MKRSTDSRICVPAASWLPTPRLPWLPWLLFVFAVCVGCGGPESLDSIRERQQSGDPAETIEALREYLARSPDDPEASYLYGRALAAAGRVSLATFPLRKAMRDPEWIIPAGTQLALVTLASNDFNETVTATTEMLEHEPDNPTALLLRAQARAHWRKDPTAALEDAERVLDLNPDTLEAYEPKILALLALDRQEEAREALSLAGERLEAVGAQEGTLAWHCSTSAVFALEAGAIEDARTQWNDCVERFPANPGVVTGALGFFDQTGDFDRGLALLEAAYAAEPEITLFRVGLANRLAALGRVEEGEALLRDATEIANASLSARAWVDLAQFHHAQGDHSAAADDLAQAIGILRPVEAPSEQLLFQYADALVAAGRLDEAVEAAADLSVRVQRELIEARVAQERGQFAEALAGFDEALRLWPNNASARYYAARAAETLGDFDRALEEYRYAIRIDPGATDARTRAAELLIAQNQHALAQQLLFLEVAPHPLEAEGEILSMYLLGRLGNPAQLQQGLIGVAQRRPDRVAEAVARGAEGAAELAGPGAALSLVSGMPGIDFSKPHAAPALRAFVRFAHDAGQPALAEQVIENSLARDPDSPVFAELRAQHLLRSGAPREAVLAAYARALELAPDNAVVLAAQARLLEEAKPEDAIRLYDEAARADESDIASRVAAARLLAAIGRPGEAVERLDAVLIDAPLSKEAAVLLVEIDLERGAVDDSTLDRARRAARLSPEAADRERVDRVLALLDRAAGEAGSAALEVDAPEARATGS